MPTLTTLTGYLYNSKGVAITTGKLYLSLPQDMISVDGTKVVPMIVTVDLSASAGLVNVGVYATVGATPAGLAYRVEFDPTPTDISIPMKQKDGYWSNNWAVPNTASVAIGSFATALRGLPAYNYIPLTGTAGTAGALVGYLTVIIDGTPRKIPYYAT
jgi:hypothetical protein